MGICNIVTGRGYSGMKLEIRPGSQPGTNEIELHGHRVSFRYAGDGPVIVLIHGITGRSDQWDAGDRAARPTATPSSRPTCSATASRPSRAATTRSAPTRARSATRWSRSATSAATIVGHSLGGGIAMQFAYQFPERCERLVLVSSGGLGREVQPAAARRDAARLGVRAAG